MSSAIAYGLVFAALSAASYFSAHARQRAHEKQFPNPADRLGVAANRIGIQKRWSIVAIAFGLVIVSLGLTGRFGP